MGCQARGNGETFLKKLITRHGKGTRKHPNFEVPRLEKNCFKILHYAAPVAYDVSSFIEKNQDPLSADLKNCMQTSSNELIAQLMPSSQLADESSPAGSEATSMSFGSAAVTVLATQKLRGSVSSKLHEPSVSFRFRGNLQALVTKLRAANTSYVRCIKPNEHKSAEVFDMSLVSKQLRCSGVLEALKIRKVTLPLHLVQMLSCTTSI